MSKAKTIMERDDEPTIAHFNFRDKGKVQPKGYIGLGIDQEVTVTIKGKVKQIGSSWDSGAQFSVEIADCEISVPANNPVSLSAAIDEAGKKRKKI